MPFALVFVGLILVVTGVKNTHAQFGKQLAGDFTGSGNFIYWVVALGSVGALGYINELRTFSRTFMTLIIVAMILAQAKDGKGGFFAAFNQQIAAGCGSDGGSGGAGSDTSKGTITIRPFGADSSSDGKSASQSISPSDILSMATSLAAFV